ncbi:efflux RND transporter permease subunit [Pseudomonas sp. F1_0610]|uniref:efflux RND transporter permease subunit n=1 Tax=Pseudomonas sp. F1_0610 TaxID=3114284 RepID=UPI0039C19850
MSKFFIHRPIFAWVLALITMLVGGLAILKLPVNQYPAIAPPAVSISAQYPGASAQTVQDTVVQVIEQQMNGIDGLLYMSSESNSDGSLEISISFEQGTDPDIAQVQVQNKLQLATPLLPQEVQQQGIRVTKSTANFLMVVGLVSTDGSMDKYDIGDYVVSNIQDPLSRTPGVGDFQVFGGQYSMRIWLDANKLNNFSLTPVDVVNAIRSQNVQVSSGQLGALPAVSGQQLNATIIGKTRYQTPEQFEDILLIVKPDGSRVHLKDVAKVELGGETYNFNSEFNGKPTTGIAVKLATGANALDTAREVRELLDSMKPFFPAGLEVVYPYDTTPVISASINGVVTTIFEATLLVFFIMFIFLQNFRVTLIPALAVPVVLLGTFGILSAFGYSINTLTMFAMVLAIGLLVDDAIVVVENVERVMTEEKLPPLEATLKSMEEIQSALIGIGVVLSAVFLPMAFFPGSTGQIYAQFSVTIISAMVLSVLVALIFTPALCATMLKTNHSHGEKRGFFGWFNRSFDGMIKKYEGGVAHIIAMKAPYLVLYAIICGAVGYMFTKVPTSFLPEEDQGVLFMLVQTPPGSTFERTNEVVHGMRDYFLTEEKDVVESIFTVTGFNFSGRGQNMAMAFVMLKPWDVRKDEKLKVFALQQRAAQRFKQEDFLDAMVMPIVPPAVMELGNASGFNFYLQDRSSKGHDALLQAMGQLLAKANAPGSNLFQVYPNGKQDEPQLQLIIDDEKARTLGLSLSDINQTLGVAWGSTYVNDFIDRGRVKKVYVQSREEDRMVPEDLDKWFVRNSEGKMVPFSSFADKQWVYGPAKLARYNGIAAVEISGAAAPGFSTGYAMNKIEEIMKDLPGFNAAWTGLSYEERLSGDQAPALYALSILIVFLCLAALYESWSVPFAVMLIVPIGVIGALGATYMRGLNNDVYFQIGLLVTIGLSARNAILIVEFAKALYEGGMSLKAATIEACRLRFRPIIMTSLAFILGVVPLAIAQGAGAGSKHAIGTGVIGGMVSAMFLTFIFVPLFFYIVTVIFNPKKNKQDTLEGNEAK